MLAGCSLQGAKTDIFDESAPSLVWPPPEQPRVKLFKVFTGTEEFGETQSVFIAFFQAIIGESSQSVGFMSPAGIVSDGERYIHIADTSACLVHEIDFIDSEVPSLTHSGVEPLVSPVRVVLDSSGNFFVTGSVKAKSRESLSRNLGHPISPVSIHTEVLMPNISSSSLSWLFHPVSKGC